MRALRKLYSAAELLTVLIILAVLSACVTMTESLHNPEAVSTEAPAVKAARTAIDEGNALLTAVNRTIGANVDAKVWTRAQAQGYLDQSAGLGGRLDQAREALRLGNPGDAQAKADAVRSLILALQRKIAEEARKDGDQ